MTTPGAAQRAWPGAAGEPAWPVEPEVAGFLRRAAPLGSADPRTKEEAQGRAELELELELELEVLSTRAPEAFPAGQVLEACRARLVGALVELQTRRALERAGKAAPVGLSFLATTWNRLAAQEG